MSLAELSLQKMNELAKPFQIKAAKEIIEVGWIELMMPTEDEVMGRTHTGKTKSSTRSTDLKVIKSTLSWHCTCTSNPKNFCTHLTATTLAIQKI
jgi:hypothetical protein